MESPPKIRTVSPDRRCQHARISWSCFCGFKFRFDSVTSGTLSVCRDCGTVFELVEVTPGTWIAIEVAKGL